MRQRNIQAPTSAIDTFSRSGDAQFAEHVLTLYNELITVRDRLGGLPPVTARDLDLCQIALHEIVWMFLTPPRNAKIDLPLPAQIKEGLRTSAEDRSNDLFNTVTALVALKLGRAKSDLTTRDDLDTFTDLLDTLCFDYRRPKRTTVEMLRRLKAEIDARLTYVTEHRAKQFVFPAAVELYSARKSRTEKPDQFFRRVYSRYVPLGLTQADIRKADPAFYNVFHVWCSRNHRLPESYAPAARQRRR